MHREREREKRRKAAARTCFEALVLANELLFAERCRRSLSTFISIHMSIKQKFCHESKCSIISESWQSTQFVFPIVRTTKEYKVD